MADKHVVIIGGGIVGLCTAYSCLKRGHRVTVLEAGEPDHDGCSLGNAGMIVPSHFEPLAAPGMVGYGLRMMLRRDSPFGIDLRPNLDRIRWCWKFMRSANKANVEKASPVLRDMHLTSRQLYQEMQGEIGDFDLTQRGLLMLCKEQATLDAEKHLAERATVLGLNVRVLDGQGLASADPGIQMHVAGGVHFVDDCHLNPNQLMSNLTTALQRMGADIRWNCFVTGWKANGEAVQSVSTSQGEFSGDEFIVAAGAWSDQVVRGLGLRLSMQSGKGYSMTLDEPRALPELCSILVEARIAVTPMGRALRIAGTMAVTGLDRSIDHKRVDGMIRSIPDYFPQIRAEVFRGKPVWSGLRPCPPDGVPYVGRFAKYPNLIAATGHAMMGVSLAPSTGEMISKLVSGDTLGESQRILSPDRV